MTYAEADLVGRIQQLAGTDLTALTQAHRDQFTAARSPAGRLAGLRSGYSPDMALRAYRSRGTAARLVSVVVVVWLVIGVLAAAQRHYFSKGAGESCATAATITTTILAGPLNYFGANPKVHCSVPQPSK